MTLRKRRTLNSEFFADQNCEPPYKQRRSARRSSSKNGYQTRSRSQSFTRHSVNDVMTSSNHQNAKRRTVEHNQQKPLISPLSPSVNQDYSPLRLRSYSGLPKLRRHLRCRAKKSTKRSETSTTASPRKVHWKQRGKLIKAYSSSATVTVTVDDPLVDPGYRLAPKLTPIYQSTGISERTDDSHFKELHHWEELDEQETYKSYLSDERYERLVQIRMLNACKRNYLQRQANSIGKKRSFRIQK